MATGSPQQRKLSLLMREGLPGLDARLPLNVARHGLATGVPTLGAYFWTRATSGPAEAGAVAFASLVGTQLAQALEAGGGQGLRSPRVVATVGGSLATLGLGFGVPAVREFFGLVAPSAVGWGAVAVSSLAAAAVSRGIYSAGEWYRQGMFAAWRHESNRLATIAASVRPLPAMLPGQG
jgi:hypothetical protein